MALTLYAVNATALFILAGLYANTMVPGALLNELMLKLQRAPSQRFFEEHHVVIALTYAAIGMLYVYPPAMMIWLSCRRRRLVFESDRTSTGTLRLGSIRRIQVAMHSVHILGHHFPRFLLLVELCEIAVQTVQGYRSSIHVYSINLNLMYGILIFANCCSSPIIFFVWETRKRQDLIGRLLCVVVDGLLDFAWAAAFQAYTLLRSKAQLDGIGLSRLHENMTPVIDQVLVVSFPNFVLSVLPFIISLFVLAELREALASAHVESSGVRPSILGELKQSKSAPVRLSDPQSHRSQFKWLHVMLSFYGVGILLLSMVSVGVFSPAPQLGSRCYAVRYPWGRGPTCSAPKINCTDRAIAGRQQELELVFKHILSSVVDIIDIYKCPEFEMPLNLGPFINLNRIVITDTTIAAWDRETLAMAPQLTSVSLTRVSFKCSSAKFMNLPDSVTDISFAGIIGADWILDTANLDWTTVTSFTCFQCNLFAVPSAILKMDNLENAILDFNMIDNFPEDGLGQKKDLTLLTLSGNPINKLPATLWIHLPALTDLFMDFTNISSVPRLAPIDAVQSPTVYARETPLCNGAENASYALWPVVECHFSW